ncbi:MAG: FAD-binding oxidoreductase [Candidatus Zixiibacteriota bacterium]|nr:MAG: FAD-binding oxidoreductase [candidate division Zixibacteria bacterium]
MCPERVSKLRKLLGAPDSLITDLREHQSYLTDATYFSETPISLLLAESVSDIVTTVDFCGQHNVPITPRGAGTGLSGGCVASEGALLLSTEKLRDLQIDPSDRSAVCGPGVITKELQDAAAAYGLAYPPDPASYEESTLGGNVAEGAGGLSCNRFGVTKDYILGLEAVLADGSLLKCGRFCRNRGFSIGDILIASEGTLAIITRIAVRLIPLPGQDTTILVAFDQPHNAAQTVADINAAGIIPTVMEFMDGDAVECSNQYEQTEGLDNAAAILLFETSDVETELQTAQIGRLCQDNNCSYLRIESDPARAEALWQIRRNLSLATKDAAAYRISEDVAVPNSHFPALVDLVAQMNAQSSLRINSYGHAGDGNLHVNFMAGSDSPENMAEIDRWVEKLMRRTVELDGTLTGEHGIGLAKRAYLDLEFDSSTLGAMMKIKSVFDPHGLLNPDKILPH